MPISITVSVAVRAGDRVLVVQEMKPAHYGRWNLPGGHVEFGETIQQAARREVAEETGLSVALVGLIGVYNIVYKPDRLGVRFVFTASAGGATPIAGHDILDLQWRRLDELDGLPDAQLVHAPVLRRILADLKQNRRYPLETLVEIVEGGVGS
jgi:ADP-ribose pyrophosphatase YjhB (NUDIX family)